MASVNGRLKRWTRILYVVATENKPLNPYKVWTKLVKEEVATQPTIRSDLEELLKRAIVKNVDTDRKARGGRPSDYYDLTLFGLGILVSQFKDLEGTKMDSQQFATHIAEKYRRLLPEVFDLWPEFIEEKIDGPAWLFLTYSMLGWEWEREFATPDRIAHRFFETIAAALLRPGVYPEHEAWLHVVARNEPIRATLAQYVLDSLAKEMEETNQLLCLLPDHSCNMNAPRFNKAFGELWMSMTRVDREMLKAILEKDGQN